MQKLSWTTVQKRVNDFIPQEVNPRKMSTKQMSDLKKSLAKYGLVEIPAIDYDGKILAGHQRIAALKLLGRGDEIIDVRYPNRKLSDEEAKQYLIASNAISGDWDMDLLKAFDFGLLLEAGFDEMELSRFWDEEKDTKDDGFDVEKELSQIKQPITQKGDLIIMGPHKLLCTSSTDIQAMQKLFGDEKASAIYSDPPFNINLSYDKGVGNSRNYGGTIDDNKSPEEYIGFIRKTLKCALAVTYEDAHVAYWIDEAWLWVPQTLYMELGIKNRRINIWVKNNASPVPTVAFNKCTEFCVYGTKGNPFLNSNITNLNEIQNKSMSTGNQLLEDISNLWMTKRLPAGQMEHPTSKNPSLHHKFIIRCTKPGDIILDSFSGSASTMIAAEQLGRRVYSLEIEPIFCDLAIKRYKKLTGRDAEVIPNYYEKE